MEQTNKKIALLHHIGCGNLGDDAVVDAVMGKIRQRWENVEFTIISMNRYDSAVRHGVPCYPIRWFQWNFGPKSLALDRTQANQHRFKSWLKNSSNPVIRRPKAVLSEIVFLSSSYKFLKSFDLLIVSGGGQLTERGGLWGFSYAIYVWTLMAKWAG